MVQTPLQLSTLSQFTPPGAAGGTKSAGAPGFAQTLAARGAEQPPAQRPVAADSSVERRPGPDQAGSKPADEAPQADDAQQVNPKEQPERPVHAKEGGAPDRKDDEANDAAEHEGSTSTFDGAVATAEAPAGEQPSQGHPVAGASTASFGAARGQGNATAGATGSVAPRSGQGVPTQQGRAEPSALGAEQVGVAEQSTAGAQLVGEAGASTDQSTAARAGSPQDPTAAIEAAQGAVARAPKGSQQQRSGVTENGGAVALDTDLSESQQVMTQRRQGDPDAHQDDRSPGEATAGPQVTRTKVDVRTEAVFQVERLADVGNAPQRAEPIAGARASAPSGPQTTGAVADGKLMTQTVTRGLSAALQQSDGEVTLRLSPASLGLVRIRMTLDHGSVAVRLEATTQAAQAMLSDQLGALRGALEARGLAVDKLAVHHTPLSAGNSGGTGSSAQQHSSGSDQLAQDRAGHDAGGAPSQGRRDGSGEAGEGDTRTGPGEDPNGPQSSGEIGFAQEIRLKLEAVA